MNDQTETTPAAPPDQPSAACCAPVVQATCCEPTEKAECCDDEPASAGCGCQ
jgi:arsenite methyltransferase